MYQHNFICKFTYIYIIQVTGLSQNGRNFCCMCLATQQDLQVYNGHFNQRTYPVRTRQTYEQSYQQFITEGNKNKSNAKVCIYIYIYIYICIYLLLT